MKKFLQGLKLLSFTGLRLFVFGGNIPAEAVTPAQRDTLRVAPVSEPPSLTTCEHDSLISKEIVPVSMGTAEPIWQDYGAHRARERMRENFCDVLRREFGA